MRGIVASRLGRHYVGIELRPEQVEANRAQVAIAAEPLPVWRVGDAIHIYRRPFSDVAKALPPFPSDPHYDAKAWEVLGLDPGMTARKGPGRVVFWNVAGPARP